MAIIDSRGRIRGPIHNLVYRVVGKKNIIQSRSRNIKQTAATQASGLEFGLASTSACVIRHAFSPIVRWSDSGMINRWTQAVLKSIRGSRSKQRGERDLHDGDTTYLQGFQFNTSSPLTEVLSVRPTVAADQQGMLSIHLPAFKEYGDIKGPKDPSLCKLRLLVVAFHFKEESYEYLRYEEIEIPRSGTVAAQTWQIDTRVVPGNLILVGMSMDFYGIDYLTGAAGMNSKDYSPAEIIGAFQVNDEQPAAKEEGGLSAGRNRTQMNPYRGAELIRKMAAIKVPENEPLVTTIAQFKVKGIHLLPGGKPPE